MLFDFITVDVLLTYAVDNTSLLTFPLADKSNGGNELVVMSRP
jgi:hypothetical protein